MVSSSLKPYAFLMVSLALLLQPSTAPEESPFDANPFSNSGSCFSSIFYFLPVHLLRPCGKEQSIRIRLLILASGPDHAFHHATTLRTIDQSHGLRQQDRNRPQKHIFNSPDKSDDHTPDAVCFAARTDWFRILPRLNVKLDLGSRFVFAPSGFALDKGLVFLNRVQDRLELHSGVPFFRKQCRQITPVYGSHLRMLIVLYCPIAMGATPFHQTLQRICQTISGCFAYFLMR